MQRDDIPKVIAAQRKRFDTRSKEWEDYLQLYNAVDWRFIREYPTGSRPETDEVIKVDSNYPFGFVDTVTATVVPVVTKIETIPRRRADQAIAQAQSRFLNTILKTQRTSDLLRTAVAKTLIFGQSFIKTVWNEGKQTIRYYHKDPRRVWYDYDASKWEEIRYLIEVTAIKKEVFEERQKQGFYKVPADQTIAFSAYPEWLDSARIKNHDQDEARAVFQYVVIYEVYDFETRKFYHITDNDVFLHETDLPYKNVPNPYILLTFNDNLIDLTGLSDVQLIWKLQKILNEIDTLELQHAAATIPVTLVNAGALAAASEFLQVLKEANLPGGLVQVSVNSGHTLRDLFAQTPAPQLSPAFSMMRQRVLQAIEFVLGLPQYARGVVGVTDVATEAALADTALRTRMGKRIQMVNDVVEALCFNTIALYEQFLRDDQEVFTEPERGQDAPTFSKQALGLTREQFFEKYEAVAHSPLNNNAQFKLQQLQTLFPMLVQNPNVNLEIITQEILTLLEMPQAFKPTPPPPPPGAPGMPAGLPPGGLPGMPPGLPPEVAGAMPMIDSGGLPNMAGGDMPAGTEPPVTTPLPGRPAFGGQ